MSMAQDYIDKCERQFGKLADDDFRWVDGLPRRAKHRSFHDSDWPEERYGHCHEAFEWPDGSSIYIGTGDRESDGRKAVLWGVEKQTGGE